jgi:hypothetical protein
MKIKILLISLCFLFLRPAVGQSFVNSSDFELLKEYVQKRDFVNGWQVAQLNADEYLGDADFDFLYGIAALEQNNNELAVFAFERVVANKPLWLDAKYYLAKSYFRMKNYHAVLQLCNTLLTQTNSSQALISASTSLKASAQLKLDKQSVFYQQQVSLAAGYDSNINAGADEDNIYLPILGTINIKLDGTNFELNEASKENSDNFLSLNYLFSGSKALSQKSKLLFFTQADIHQFVQETDYNRITLNGSISYLQQFDNFDASVGVNIKPLWLSGDYYRTQASVNGGIKKRLSDQFLLSGDVSLGKTKNNINDNLDTNDLVLSFSGQYFMGNWRHTVALNYLEEDSQSAETTHNSSKTDSIHFNSLWLINQNWLMSGAVSWQRQKYSGEHPYFFTPQVDDMFALSTMVQFKASNELSYRLNASYQDKDSNLSLFSYQRFELGLSASLTF